MHFVEYVWCVKTKRWARAKREGIQSVSVASQWKDAGQISVRESKKWRFFQ